MCIRDRVHAVRSGIRHAGAAHHRQPNGNSRRKDTCREVVVDCVLYGETGVSGSVTSSGTEISGSFLGEGCTFEIRGFRQRVSGKIDMVSATAGEGAVPRQRHIVPAAIRHSASRRAIRESGASGLIWKVHTADWAHARLTTWRNQP